MKKIFAMFMSILFTVLLVACSNNATTDVKDDTNASQITTEKNTEKNVADSEEKEIIFAETIVVDNEDCLIKITEIDTDNMWGYTLKVLFENKSAEKTYTYSVESAAINGVETDPFFAAEVAAGKKANKEINFSDSLMKKIGDYTDIEVTFRVHDSNDWSADDVANETVHIYPYGEDKAVKFNREAQSTDNVLIDNEYVTVIVTGYESDDIWGYTVNLFLVNKTDKNVMFSVDNASVNGYMADPFYANAVCAGKCEFGSMSWSDSVFEENGITSVENIEFKLRAYDDDNWNGNDFVSELITLYP